MSSGEVPEGQPSPVPSRQHYGITKFASTCCRMTDGTQRLRTSVMRKHYSSTYRPPSWHTFKARQRWQKHLLKRRSQSRTRLLTGRGPGSCEAEFSHHEGILGLLSRH